MLRIICFLFILTQVSCTIGQDNLDQVQADNLLLNLAPETNNTDWDREMKLDRLLTLLYNTDKDLANDILADLIANWEEGFITPLVEIMRLRRELWLVEKINKVLLLKTKESGVEDFYDWLQWLWNREELKSDYYLEFKANVYQNIDPKFHKYFNGRDSESSIRFDEVVWGGVVQDGIPPLRLPELINPDEADYLADTDVVFGFYINGVAKAYPKRILAWHEFVVDDFDGKKIAGVYCTLCGTVIAYDMVHKGKYHDLGTSGFLYKSNKLMYDRETQSLWNTIEGKPVIGPLVGQDINLDLYPVITTTWGEWRSEHPDTKVLSLNTGHRRDYGEGVAYKEYFATDEIMFPVPLEDNRLKNKDQVMILRVDGYKNDPAAISVNHLENNQIKTINISNRNFVLITDEKSFSRAYEQQDIEFVSYNNGAIVDANQQTWQVEEDYLISPTGKKLNRVASHNIFWFAWFNTYPETRLIK